MGLLVGYARVSTEDQSLDLQLRALREAGVLEDNIHIDKASGTSIEKREGLVFALKDCRDGDVLVVWRVDRLSRNLRDLHTILDELKRKGVGFRSITEQIDISTPAGRLALNMLGSFGQFERDSIAQRTKAGIAAIKAKRGAGFKWGPKLYMTPKRIEQVGKLLNSGMTGPQVAEKLGISSATVYAHWKQSGHHKWVRRLPSRKPEKD